MPSRSRNRYSYIRCYHSVSTSGPEQGKTSCSRRHSVANPSSRYLALRSATARGKLKVLEIDIGTVL